MKASSKLLVMAAVALATLSASVNFANAAIVNLRPNADLSNDNWKISGASSAWEALDDAVESPTIPNATDNISAGKSASEIEVGLTTTPIAGASSLKATAWFYAPEGGVEARVKSGSKKLSGWVEGSKGWSKIPITINSQGQLDDASLVFFPEHSGSVTVTGAYLNLTFTPATPKLYWGAWMDGEVYSREGDAPWDSETWGIFKEHTGKSVSIVHFGQPAPWEQKFASEPLTKTIEKGAIPMMDMDSDGVSLSSLKSGAEDAALKEWAEEVKEYGKPFFFRWQWEMNLKSTQLGKEASESPESYVAVWQRFHDIAESVKATNITWVWCPNVIFPESTPLKSLYPGNSYVDWTCMDGYNHGTKTTESGGWKNFYSVFSETYNELTSGEFAGHEKPIMIGETASTEAGGSKSEWIAEGLGNYLPNKFPGIKAVLWFNWNITEKGTEWDWPIESSTASTESFANAIASPYYAENSFKELEPLTRIQPLS